MALLWGGDVQALKYCIIIFPKGSVFWVYVFCISAVCYEWRNLICNTDWPEIIIKTKFNRKPCFPIAPFLFEVEWMHFKKYAIRIGFFSGEHLVFKNEDQIFLLDLWASWGIQCIKYEQGSLLEDTFCIVFLCPVLDDSAIGFCEVQYWISVY